MIIYDLWYERVMKVLQRLTLVAPTLKKVDAQALHWGGLSCHTAALGMCKSLAATFHAPVRRMCIPIIA